MFPQIITSYPQTRKNSAGSSLSPSNTSSLSDQPPLRDHGSHENYAREYGHGHPNYDPNSNLNFSHIPFPELQVSTTDCPVACPPSPLSESDTISFFNEKEFVSPNTGKRKLSIDLNIFLGTLDPDEDIAKVLMRQENTRLLNKLNGREETKFLTILLGEMTKDNMVITKGREVEGKIFRRLTKDEVTTIASNFFYFAGRHSSNPEECVRTWFEYHPALDNLCEEEPMMKGIFLDIAKIMVRKVSWKNHTLVRKGVRMMNNLRGRMYSIAKP